MTGREVRLPGCIAAWCAALIWSALGCGTGALDAGSDAPHGILPVDERNPYVIVNDGYIDNWQGEYALLFANSGSTLAGIVVTTSSPWPNLDANLAGWRAMVSAARVSGMKSAPDPVASTGSALVRPSDGKIDSTQANASAGARFIIDVSRRLSLPYRPLVVAFGTRLTDVADAYLLDPTLPDRVVVVASLGSAASDGGTMGFPNGDLDPWADTIVAQKFRYIQVSAFYDQTADVPSSRISQLPNNAFGMWMASKQGTLWGPIGADQVSVLASVFPSFALAVTHASPSAATSSSGGGPPSLTPNATGPVWLVTQSAGTSAATRLWQMLLDPGTFRH